MIGRFALSLHRLVADELDTWRQSNSAFNELRGNWSERWMYAATTNVGRLFRYWCLATAAIVVGSYFAQLYDLFPTVAPTTDIRLDRILTVQTTVAALTYPIVLALVGILLQRSWSDLRVRVYVAYSGALLAGASSLLLISVLVVYLSVFRAMASPYLDRYFSDAAVIWLLVNVALTTFFLFRSLRYLTPEVQQRALIRFAAEVLWPNELEGALLQLRWQNAPSIRWPPNEDRENQQPLVGPSVYGLSRSNPEVSYRGRSTRWLIDVRIRPLRWVARRWKRRLPQDETTAWLIFPIAFDQAIEKGTSLCRRSGSAGLTFIDKWLVRFSFRLSGTEPHREDLSLANVMDELGDAAIASISDGRVNSFSRALANLLEFHRIAVQLGEFEDGPEAGNYLEMQNNPLGSMQTQHARFLDPYRKLAQRLIDNADTEIEALREAAHSTDAILSYVRDTASLEVREQLVFITGFQWGALRARRHRSADSVSEAQAGNGSGAERPHSGSTDDKIVRTLCGAWDSIAFQVLRQADLKGGWNSLTPRGKECIHFLERSIGHVLAAVADNDTLVSRWAMDLVQRWPGYWLMILDEYAIWEEFPQASEGVLELSWEATERALGISGEGLRSEGQKQREVFGEVLLNAWRDACGFLVTWLMAQTRDDDPRQELCRGLLKALVAGDVLKGSGSTHCVRQPFEHYDATLAAWLRPNLVDSASPNLVGHLWDRLADRAKDSTRLPWVSGRAYGSGDDDEGVDLVHAALLRILLGTGVEIRIGQTLSDRVLEFAGQGAIFAGRVVRRLTHSEDHLRGIDLAPWLPAFRALQPSTTVEDIDAKRLQLADEFRALRERIETRNSEQVDQRPLDQAHIDAIEDACNRIAFSRDLGGLPLPFFDVVETAGGEADEFTLKLPQRDKAELVYPPLATRVSNELSWYEKTARDYVALDVRSKIAREIQSQTVVVATNREFAEALDVAAGELHEAGMEALLFVGHRRDLGNQWHADPESADADRPKPFTLEKHDGYAHPGYLFHANGVPAIRMFLQEQAAFLIPQECFERVRFMRMPNGKAARLDVTEQPEHRMSLALMWALEITLRDVPSYRFVFRST